MSTVQNTQTPPTPAGLSALLGPTTASARVPVRVRNPLIGDRVHSNRPLSAAMAASAEQDDYEKPTIVRTISVRTAPAPALDGPEPDGHIAPPPSPVTRGAESKHDVPDIEDLHFTSSAVTTITRTYGQQGVGHLEVRLEDDHANGDAVEASGGGGDDTIPPADDEDVAALAGLFHTSGGASITVGRMLLDTLRGSPERALTVPALSNRLIVDAKPATLYGCTWREFFLARGLIGYTRHQQANPSGATITDVLLDKAKVRRVARPHSLALPGSARPLLVQRGAAYIRNSDGGFANAVVLHLDKVYNSDVDLLADILTIEFSLIAGLCRRETNPMTFEGAVISASQLNTVYVIEYKVTSAGVETTVHSRIAGHDLSNFEQCCNVQSSGLRPAKPALNIRGAMRPTRQRRNQRDAALGRPVDRRQEHDDQGDD